MGALISALASFLANVFMKSFLANKIVLSFLFITVLPIVLYNLAYEFISLAYNLLISALPEEFEKPQFIGLAAWLLENLYFLQSLSVIASAIATRVAISVIPFVRG